MLKAANHMTRLVELGRPVVEQLCHCVEALLCRVVFEAVSCLSVVECSVVIDGKPIAVAWQMVNLLTESADVSLEHLIATGELAMQATSSFKLITLTS